MLKQCIVFFARSDWLLNLRISNAIHCFTSTSSKKLFLKYTEKATKFGLEVLTGKALSVRLEFIVETGENVFYFPTIVATAVHSRRHPTGFPAK